MDQNLPKSMHLSQRSEGLSHNQCHNAQALSIIDRICWILGKSLFWRR
jgi:hypothetical protein